MDITDFIKANENAVAEGFAEAISRETKRVEQMGKAVSAFPLETLERQMSKIVASMTEDAHARRFARDESLRGCQRSERTLLEGANGTGSNGAVFDSFRTVPRPPARPFVAPVDSGLNDFLREFKERLETMTQEAEETGGELLVTCTTASGDKITVKTLSSTDRFFVTVVGVDAFGQRREFTGQYSALGIGMEIIPQKENDKEDETIN